MSTTTTTLIWPEKLSSHVISSVDVNSHRRVIAELVSGRDSAVQLQNLLRNESNGNKRAGSSNAVLAREFAEKILRSFSESIYQLSCVESGEFCDDGGSVDDSGSTSKKRPVPGSKEGRGCYKRRKGSQTWTEVSTTMEDNYAWRKYGQKEILNAKFPRCYFRCTHKHDQGCRATKQVQKMEDGSNMFRITYIGLHTCQRTCKLSPQIITDTDPWEAFSDSSKPQCTAPAAVKPEYFKEETASDATTENSFSSLGPIFDREPAAVQDVSGLYSLDVDEFMASYGGLDSDIMFMKDL